MASETQEQLTKFIASLEHRVPTLPDEVTRYLLRSRGWNCKATSQETQLLRLISLAAQKFVANVSYESLQIYKQRRRQTQARLKEQGLKDQKTILTLEDTAAALQETNRLALQYGVNLKPVPYYLDHHSSNS